MGGEEVVGRGAEAEGGGCVGGERRGRRGEGATGSRRQGWPSDSYGVRPFYTRIHPPPHPPHSHTPPLQVYKLPDLWIRPSFGGKGRKVPGALEAHANGFRSGQGGPVCVCVCVCVCLRACVCGGVRGGGAVCVYVYVGEGGREGSARRVLWCGCTCCRVGGMRGGGGRGRVFFPYKGPWAFRVLNPQRGFETLWKTLTPGPSHDSLGPPSPPLNPDPLSPCQVLNPQG